jgi:hypothetical protein
MSLKESMQRRIEKAAIKVNVNGEDILLKNSGLIVKEWHRFHPPIDENGNWNWLNFIFGGKSNLVNLIAILVIIGLLFFGLGEIFGGMQNIIDSPCVQSCLNKTILIMPN